MDVENVGIVKLGRLQMASRYWCRSLIGGVLGSLDNIDPDDTTDTPSSPVVLVVGDICQVINSTDVKLYWYVAKSLAAQVEDSPNIIIPDNNPGDWYWELITSTDDILIQAKAYAIIFG